MRKLFLFILLLLILCGLGPKHVPKFSEQDVYKLPGLTLWLDSSDLSSYEDHLSSTRTVERWNSRVGSIYFENTTAAEQPVRTLPVNNENRVTYSEDISNAVWSEQRGSSGSATEFTEDSATGEHRLDGPAFPVILGETYVLSASFKRGTGSRNAALRHQQSAGAAGWAYIDLSDCTLDSSAATSTTPVVYEDPDDATYCRVVFTDVGNATGSNSLVLYMISGATTISYAGDSSSSIHFTRMSANHQDANSYYQPTTDHALYRGSKGRTGIRSDGVDDGLGSISVTSDIFGAGAKTWYIAGRTEKDQTASMFVSASAYWLSGVAGGNDIRCMNYDGTTDIATSSMNRGETFIHTCWHDGTNLYSQVDSGAISSTASGNTSNINTALNLWGGTGGAASANGTIFELITANKVHGSATRAKVRKYLCDKWGANC